MAADLIHRSYDANLLNATVEKYKDIIGELDGEAWLNAGHVMFAYGDSVGLARKEYPGVYTVHWFFTVRGRQAIELAKGMLKALFDETDAKAVRGLIKIDLRNSQWAARQLGMQSHGIIPIRDDKYELFILNKEDL